MINFYSDRPSDTGAHNVSSGIITDLKNSISQLSENASDMDNDLRFSIAPEEENLIVMHNVTAAKLRKAALQMATMENDLRFALMDYSESEQYDIIAILKPFVGHNIMILQIQRYG